MPGVERYEFRTEPYRHQGFEGVLQHWWQPHWGLLLEMGAGKSKILIDNACVLYGEGLIACLLIIAPKGVYGNWVRKEIPAHMPERVLGPSTIHLWRGGYTVTERGELENLCNPGPGLRVLVANTEAVLTPAFQRWIQRFRTVGPMMMGVDESSTIKNPDAKRTNEIIRLGRMAAYRRIMTGTPVTRSPLDLWSQFEFLEPGCLGHRRFQAFKHRYGIISREHFSVPGGKPGQKRRVDLVVGFRDIDKLSHVVARHASVIRKEDCLDLPPKVYEEREVELTAEQRRIYRELVDYATAELEAGRFMTTTSVITQLLRLHQVVCGTATDEDGQISYIPNNRPAVLLEDLDESDGPSIVWATYRHDIEVLEEVIRKSGRRVVTYHGGTSERDRGEAVRLFQAEGTLPWQAADVFLGTQSAGGYGITLTRARYSKYYSNNYDLEKRLQSEDRPHRIGQRFSVTNTDLVARGTVDEAILSALRRKLNLANLIMDGPARIRELFGSA